jgi:hypothetical protein
MTDYVYKPGDRVRTPGRGEGIVVAVHPGPVRGRMWREPQYSIDLPGARYATAFYESDLQPVDGS